MAYRRVRFSKPVFRAMWLDPAVSCAAMRVRFDCSQEYLTARAKEMGLPSREHQRPARLEGSLLVEMWMAGVRVEDICAHFDCSRTGLSDAIDRLNLPKRPSGGGGVFMLTIDRFLRGIRIDGPEFRDMWASDVSLEAMAEYFGFSAKTVAVTARKLGLPRRPMGRGARIGLAEWTERRAADSLRAAMAETARREMAALNASEMVDRVLSPANIAGIAAARQRREAGLRGAA